MIVMATLSGIASGTLLAMANSAAEIASKDELEMELRTFLMFGIALILFIYSKRYSMMQSNREVEKMVRKVRVRITDKILKAELQALEKLGKAEIFTAISNQTMTVSQSGTIIINACQSTIMIVACLLYITWLSFIAGIVIIVAVILGTSLYISHRKEVITEFMAAMDKEREFFTILDGIFKGFKEIKVFKKRGDDIFAHAQEIAAEAEAKKINISEKLTVDYMFSQVFFYSLIGVIVFVLPEITTMKSETLLKLTASILFIIGPLDSLVGSSPIFSRATAAIENLYKLEKSLEEASVEAQVKGKPKIKKFVPFQNITLENVVYKYKDKEDQPLFTVGPINLSIRQGEILFIVGGNGTGKTSLLRLITGLYSPQEGTLKLDEKKISLPDYPNYRELYSVIFWDFHLFDRLYGLLDSDEERVNELLIKMQVEEKTEYEEGRFTNLELSTGQKKRLALIISILEDKEIFIFDEWTADQDPPFRKHFFEVLIKDLQKKGKTIIAVSHDDRYFHLADRVIKMEDGQVLENNIAHG